MTAKCTAQLLADLDVTPSLGRARASNDNPYSEAHFKTVKYHPGFPGRFADVEDAKDFRRRFLHWYNTEHRHGGIGLLTPLFVESCSSVLRDIPCLLSSGPRMG